MGENFKLKWNDHHSIFFSTAEELCMEDNLTDITLSCGKQEFSAHKLVLSICSTYFKDLFAPRQNQKGNSKYHRPASQAAIVYLKDVKPSHMELLLNFMYRGEIHVQEDELMELLTTAKGLQIRGLSESDIGEEESNHPSITAIPKNKTAEASSPLKTKKNKAVKRPSKEAQQPSTSKKIKEEAIPESPDLSTENAATENYTPDDQDLMEETEEDQTQFQEENVDEMSYDQTDLVQPEVS